METLLPYAHTLALIRFITERANLVAIVRAKADGAWCPLCGVRSIRIHSRYERTLLDIPWHGVALRLQVQVRRFFCDALSCERHIFAERLPDVAAPYARRTTQMDAWLQAIGLALGGEAGARLLKELGMTSSPDTVLRQVTAPTAAPRQSGAVIGIDEFGFRRGRRFATIIVDLTTHRVLDLLPDVQRETVVTWLQAHPHITTISRDRAYNFSEAITQGAPQATQIADRWHLLKNLGERVEAVLRNHKAVLATPRGDLLAAQGITLGRTREMHQRATDWHQQRLDLYQQIHAAKQHGLNQTAIVKLLGVSKPTVAKYLAMTSPHERLRLPSGVLRPNAAFVPYIYQRWNEGCRNGAQIHRELRCQRRLTKAHRRSRCTPSS